MNRMEAISKNLQSGELSMKEFKEMLECAYGCDLRQEQLLLQAAAERAGQRFEAAARRIADRMR